MTLQHDDTSTVDCSIVLQKETGKIECISQFDDGIKTFTEEATPFTTRFVKLPPKLVIEDSDSDEGEGMTNFGAQPEFGRRGTE